MPQVRLRPGKADEVTIPSTVGWERKQAIGKMRRLLIDLPRGDLADANLTPKEDMIELVGVDTVRLVDIQTGGPTWTLVCYSAEWDANRSAHLPGGTVRQGSDADIISTLVGDVSSWSAGSIASLAGDLTFVFNHAHEHEAVRRVERNVPGEIQFRDFGTVDYVDRLGSDRSGNIELSASESTIEQGITITDRGRELDGTHIRVLGAHEGEAQLFVNLVPDADPNTYPNEVRYTTPRWDSAADTDWDRWENKDVTDQSTLETEAASLADEISTPLVEAKAKVPATVGLTIGDTVRVVKPDADLDRDMRVHRLRRQGGARNQSDSSATVIDDVLLSTRTTMRADEGESLRDIQRFNTGFQGNSVVIQGGGSRQPVTASDNAVIPFDYPNIVFENEATLHVRGLPYRAYSSGAANNPTFDEEDVDEGSSGSVSVTDETWTTVASFDPAGPVTDVDTQSVTYTGSIQDFASPARIPGRTDMDMRLQFNFGSSGTTRDFWPVQGGYNAMVVGDDVGRNVQLFSATLPGPYYDLAQVELQVRITALEGSTNLEHQFTGVLQAIYEETHTHPADPGLIEFGGETPSNVDVIVNGSTVATSIGSGEFESTVDISDTLDRNSWNDIELTSDTLGHLQGTVSVRGYEQIGKSN